MVTTRDREREAELIRFVSEMNELVEKGMMREKFDFKDWLQYSRTGCKYCFNELSEIVNVYMDHV